MGLYDIIRYAESKGVRLQVIFCLEALLSGSKQFPGLEESLGTLRSKSFLVNNLDFDMVHRPTSR